MENFEKYSSAEKKEKPKFLYHGSPNREIEEFEPRAETFRDIDEGPKIFATPDKAYASMFIVPVDDRWAQIATFEGVNCIVISDKERFEELDHGSSIYTFSSETFNTDPEKSKTGREWTSDRNVKPIDKTVYESGLEAMIENGVQVYFVDKSTFEKIQRAEDYGLSILKRLKSENKRRGKNVIEFTD